MDQLDGFKRERRQAEQAMEDMETRLKKSQMKLSGIKSNKEYRAALKEIADLEKEKALVEDRVLDIMEQTEALHAKHKEDQEKMEEHQRLFEKDRSEILRELQMLEKELENLEKERTEFNAAVDEELLKKYDFLRDRKGGVAVSPVIKCVCQACHMGIPPQQFNELIRGDAMMSCPNCQRIIYWGEDERLEVKARETLDGRRDSERA
jgi:predicted  nucleic acid-binding Zn-ribbon protein